MPLWILGLSSAFAVALSGTMVMPIVVLAMSRIPGFDEATATIVASAELAGIALYGIFLPRLANRLPRTVAVAGILAVLAGQASSYALTTPLLLALARLVAGLGEGAVFSLIAVRVASRPNAERLWGALNLIGGTTMGLLLLIISVVPAAPTQQPVFGLLTGFVLLMLPFFLLMGGRPPIPAGGGKPIALGRGAILRTMIVVFLVYAVQAGQWAICGYVGERAGLSTGTVGLFLALSSVAGFLGAVVPAVTRRRNLRLPLVLAGLLVMAVSLYLFFNVPGGGVFLVAQITLNIGFYMATPFVTGLLTETDPDGALLSRILVVALFGAAVGTAAAGPILTAVGPSGFGWIYMLPLGLSALLAALVFGRLHVDMVAAAAEPAK
ncbi:MFS transporter [Rhizobium sp. TRM95111]|uniref:MFS transporter n=1 Tax=Rhizobium alarense TaxID=2846851 RepID=UPI001F3BA41E|nr:MFS transporter [Rhizobium alarense]MCF3641277.1 MFS transporter [Rhizobium alarense]